MAKNNRKKASVSAAEELKRKKCEIAGICLIALGIFSLFCVFTSLVGVVGQWLGGVFFGALGIYAYVVPFAFGLGGIMTILSYKRHINALKAVFFVLGILGVLLLTHSIYAGGARFELENFGTAVSSSWTVGMNQHGGAGVIGGVLFSAVYFLIDITGCVILSVLLIASSVIMLTNLSLKRMGTRIRERSDERRRIRREEREERREARKNQLYIGKVENPTKKTLPEPKETGDRTKLPRLDLAQYDEFEKYDREPKKTPRTRRMPENTVKPQPAAATAPVKAKPDGKKEYVLPPISLLRQPDRSSAPRENTAEKAATLLQALKSFGVAAQVQSVTTGPSITRYEVALAPGVKLSRVQALQDDIALAMAANGIRIAPIPGKSTVGVEVPNTYATAVLFRDVVDSAEFRASKSKISVAFGKDGAGNVITADLHKMPHLLIAGATGSGKSVCMNTIIASILYKARPDEVKLIMIDPKVVELSIYNGIPHMAVPVVTSPKKAAGALNWAKKEMEGRYAKFSSAMVKDLAGYNEWAQKNGEEKLPQIVILIDELSDLMMVAGKEIEDSICRLAQMARAAGMYLVLATQRPSVDVITGVIKANIPSRIAFAVSSSHDSRTIIDMIGAEKLLGKGDMLYFPAGIPKPIRAQGAFVSEEEIENIVEFVKAQGASDSGEMASLIQQEMEMAANGTPPPDAAAQNGDKDDEEEELFKKAVRTVIINNQSSVSFVQRKLKIGFNHASNLVEMMEERGILGKPDPSNKNMRAILMTPEEYMLTFKVSIDDE
ncbi:MAG: hypothetical protein KIG36_03315 [Eubacteriales bacterium]|nr:hypothetical protein [Eubacteriales bacterium]